MYKLLLADDELIELEALRYIINNSDLPITEIQDAVNGKKAVEIAKSFKPDFIIMDIKMPGMSGIEAATIIRSLLPKSQIIFLSAFNQFNYAKKALQLSAHDFLVKPVSTDQLLSSLSAAIEQYESLINSYSDLELSKKNVTELSRHIEDEFIQLLITPYCDEDSINKYKSLLLLDKYFYGCLILQIHEINVPTLKLQHIMRYVKEILSESSSNCYCIFKHNTFYILINTDEKLCHNFIDKALDDISKHLQQHFYLNTKGTFTLNCTSLLEINQGFQQLIKSFNTIHKPSNNNSSSTINLELDLLDSIKIQNKEKIESLVKDFLGIVYEQSHILPSIKNNLYDLSIFLHKSLVIEYPLKATFLNTIFLSLKESLRTTEFNTNELELLFLNTMNEVSSVLTEDFSGEQDQNPSIQKVCQYIHKNYMHNISLNNMADYVNLSPHYLSKLFKLTMNLTFCDYITHIRILEAKKLLKNTDLPIQIISAQVGYKDPNYFTRTFRKLESLTPNTYRKKLLHH